QMEISRPWKNITKSGKPHGYLGLDIHINDNDGNTRNWKLAWWAKRDNSYQTPAVFGTVRLRE
ncbi:MAG: sugar-binding protein, partial [Candidatus Neomarinimicrobiota bacterium]